LGETISITPKAILFALQQVIVSLLTHFFHYYRLAGRRSRIHRYRIVCRIRIGDVLSELGHLPLLGSNFFRDLVGRVLRSVEDILMCGLDIVGVWNLFARRVPPLKKIVPV